MAYAQFENCTVGQPSRGKYKKRDFLIVPLTVGAPPSPDTNSTGESAEKDKPNSADDPNSTPKKKKRSGSHGNGRRIKWVIDVPRGNLPVVLKVTYGRCRGGGSPTLPWIHPDHHQFTRDAIRFLIETGIPDGFAPAAKRLGTEETFVRRLCLPVIRSLHETYRPIAAPFMAVDEDHVGDRRKKQNHYLLGVYDANGPKGKRLIDLGETNREVELSRILNKMGNLNEIIAIAMDGACQYRNSIAAINTTRKIKIKTPWDRFHMHKDAFEIISYFYSAWRSENSTARSNLVECARVIKSDHLRRDPKRFSDVLKAAYGALSEVAPHIATIHRWVLDLVKIYNHSHATADRLLTAAHQTGLKLVDDHGDRLTGNHKKTFAAFVKRLEDHRDDILSAIECKLHRKGRGGVDETVSLSTGTAESYNRLIGQLYAEGRRVHFPVLRIRALCKYGPIDTASILATYEAIQALPKYDPIHARRWTAKAEMGKADSKPYTPKGVPKTRKRSEKQSRPTSSTPEERCSANAPVMAAPGPMPSTPPADLVSVVPHEPHSAFSGSQTNAGCGTPPGRSADTALWHSAAYTVATHSQASSVTSWYSAASTPWSPCGWRGAGRTS